MWIRIRNTGLNRKNCLMGMRRNLRTKMNCEDIHVFQKTANPHTTMKIRVPARFLNAYASDNYYQ
jgi:hypothetical protein